jgi:hypothetical protein
MSTSRLRGGARARGLARREHTGSAAWVMETGGFSLTLFLSFLHASFRARMSFLREEMIYCLSTLSLQQLGCHFTKLLSCQV